MNGLVSWIIFLDCQIKNNAYRRMKIGKYQIKIVDNGLFALDGGAMFGIIPKPLWERTNTPDEKNRIPLAARSMLLDSGTRRILIDTGMGDKWESKSKVIYRYEYQENILFASLRKLGYMPEDITDVILTHLHFDHCGGSTILRDGKLIPAFPNAKYHVQKKNYDWGMEPSDRDRGSYLIENFHPLMDEGILMLRDSDDEGIDDEITLPVFHGHTFFQQLPVISDGTKTLFFCGDLFPTTSHVPLPYIMGYDLQPLQTLSEKKYILGRAVREDWILFFQHDPVTEFGKVVETPKGFTANTVKV